MDKFFEPKFIISFILLSIAGGCIFYYPNSNPHLILGTNIASAVGSYWIGTSLSSANKDKILFKQNGGVNNETKPEVVSSMSNINIPG